MDINAVPPFPTANPTDEFPDGKKEAIELAGFRARLEKLRSNPNAGHIVCDHLANGGDLTTICDVWGVRYSDVSRWLCSLPDKEYQNALMERASWYEAEIYRQIRQVALTDIRDAFNDDGTLKSIKDMPAHIAQAIASIDNDELFAGSGKDREKIGDTKKIKLYDKLKAIEMLGKQIGMFVQKHEVRGTVRLEDIVAGSWPAEDKTSSTA